jgi:adenylate cyclase
MRLRSTTPDTETTDTAIISGRMVPAGVARAIRFMQDNLAANVSVRAIAAAAGLPERTLRRQFRRFTGEAPIAFHRNLKLEAARRSLRSAEGAADVTTVALWYGFGHFGQFAAQYKRHFGELPSDTLRRSRESALALPPHVAHETVTLTILPFVADEPGGMVLAGATTDGLISALGRMRWLDVLVTDGPAPGGSVMPVRSVPFRTRYVIRGHVRAIGGRMQVAVRLSEHVTGRHIWGDAYEGAPGDVLALQGRIIEAVAGTIPACLRSAEARRVEHERSRDRSAYDLTMRAFRAASRLTQTTNLQALEDLDRALLLDPELPLATALASWCHAQQAIYNFSETLGSRAEARRLAAVSLSNDDGDPLVLAVLGTASTLIGDLDLAELLIEKSLAIDPYCAIAWQRRGWIATYRGRETSLADFMRCLKLNPHDPDKANTLLGISSAHFLAGRYDSAADWAIRGVREQPGAMWAYRVAAAAQGRCGRNSEAVNSVALLQRNYPDLNIGTIVDALPMGADFLTRYAEGLESAGLPP